MFTYVDSLCYGDNQEFESEIVDRLKAMLDVEVEETCKFKYFKDQHCKKKEKVIS